MPEQTADYRLYGDLAEWWPLISPAEEYAEEAAFAAGLFGLADGPVREVLELGSGGGSNASYLTSRFGLTLVDLSAGMLAVSRQLNPDCPHVQGDMRTIRLGRTFDAVFVHDAVDYMTSEDDLGQVMRTAFEHCRPRGVAVFMPDNITETFEPGTGCGGADGADGRAARFLDWSWDPDPADTWTQTDYVYMLRRPGEPLRVVQESHRLGLFPRDTWLRLLAGTGFEAQSLTEQTSEDRRPREVFTGRRPA
jgi:SAM-dependent methyltransferase